MPLTPPPDNSKAWLSVAIGVSIACVIGLYTRNTLPIVGDNLHQLPHGGYYRDGTKAIHYGAPKKLNSVEGGRNIAAQPWVLVAILIGLIILSEKCRGARCSGCGRHH